VEIELTPVIPQYLLSSRLEEEQMIRNVTDELLKERHAINKDVKHCVDIQIRVGFEVLTAVVMNVAIVWDIAPCSPYVNRRFEEAYHLHLQGRKSAQARNQHAVGGYLGRLPLTVFIFHTA
jgi:hypothetical protein